MAADVSQREARGSAALWFGVLAGPAAWSIQVLIGYSAEEIACSSGSQTDELAGIGIETLIIAVNAALTAITFIALVVSFRRYQHDRRGDPTTGARATWMGLAGVMVSALFLVVLVSGFAPMLFLTTCTPTP
jgi:amino acid permease